MKKGLFSRITSVCLVSAMLMLSGLPVQAMSAKTQKEIEANNRAIVNELFLSYGGNRSDDFEMDQADDFSFANYLMLYNAAMGSPRPVSSVVGEGFDDAYSSNISTTAYQYDASGNIIQASSHLQNKWTNIMRSSLYWTTTDSVITCKYDDSNHLMEWHRNDILDGAVFNEDLKNQTHNVIAAYQYDGSKLSAMTVNDPEQEAARGFVFAYDAYGRIQQVTDNEGRPLRFTYKNNRIVKINNESYYISPLYSITYNKAKKPTSVVFTSHKQDETISYAFSYNADGSLAGYSSAVGVPNDVMDATSGYSTTPGYSLFYQYE